MTNGEARMRDGIADQRVVLRPVLGSARGLAIADFPKDCFGETPKPARETRALPNRLSRGFNQRCNCAFLHDFLPV